MCFVNICEYEVGAVYGGHHYISRDINLTISIINDYIMCTSPCILHGYSYKSILHKTVDTGSGVLFADITFTKLRVLPTSKKSCQFNARSITFTTTSAGSVMYHGKFQGLLVLPAQEWQRDDL